MNHLVFRSGKQKIPRKEGKKVISLHFLGPSSPRPAFGSLGTLNNFMVKKLARLGELQVSQSDPFPINRRAREAEREFQH